MKRIFVILLLAFFPVIYCNAQDSSRNIKDFGAKGDGIADDTQALIKGVQNSQILLIPAGTYNIKGVINFKGLHNKTIIADKNAIIRNTADDKGTFNFYMAENVAIHGGTWTYLHLPTHNSADGQAVYFLFSTCKNIEVTHIHLIGSAEMGFCLVADIGANISDNIIEQCYRDAIYSHYSSNLIYACNYIHDIKDDAMSVHDYGIPSQRTFLTAAGIAQSGNAIVFNNITKNTYEGFASIGCTSLFIANNNIQNTVTGGIAISNSELLFKGSTARANKIVISNNTLSYTGGNPQIMNDHHKNDYQLGPGRAAIFVGVTNEKANILDPKTRIQDVTVNNNTVTNCYENGVYIGEVDHLSFFNNFFKNNNIDEDTNTGTAVEIKDCNGVAAGENTIIDNRGQATDKDLAYSLYQVNGIMGKWNVTAKMNKQTYLITNSSLQKGIEQHKDLQLSVPAFTLLPAEYKIIKQKFTPGLLSDYINVVTPGNLTGKIVCNACIDPNDQTLILILSNTCRQALKVTAANWTVREFYHN